MSNHATIVNVKQTVKYILPKLVSVAKSPKRSWTVSGSYMYISPKINPKRRIMKEIITVTFLGGL